MVWQGRVPLAVRLSGPGVEKHLTREVQGLRFSTVAPGGFRDCELSLHRPLDIKPNDIRHLNDLVVYDGRSSETVWQGRIHDLGRGDGPGGQLWRVTGFGGMAHAHDDSRPVIHQDRSLERFSRAASSSAAGEWTVETDDAGAEALRLMAPNGTVCLAGAWEEGVDYHGTRSCLQKVGRLDYQHVEGGTDADWRVELRLKGGALTLSRDDGFSTTPAGSAAKLIVTHFEAGDDMPHVRIRRVDTDATLADDNTWTSITGWYVQNTRYSAAGSELLTAADYPRDHVLGHEIVADLLGRMLPKFDGTNASIATNTFEIGHFAHPDGADAAQLLDDLMLLEPAYIWQVWENLGAGYRFEWKPWPTTFRYEATTADGFDNPSSIDDVYNAVNVRWVDHMGRVRLTVRTSTVPTLTNAGLTRRAYIDLGTEVGSENNAIRVGDEFLTEHALPSSGGTLTVSRPILDVQTGRLVMPWEVKSGYLIRVRNTLPTADGLNINGRDAVSTFRIRETDFDAGQCSNQLSLDGTPRSLAALIAKAAKAQQQRRR